MQEEAWFERLAEELLRITKEHQVKHVRALTLGVGDESGIDVERFREVFDLGRHRYAAVARTRLDLQVEEGDSLVLREVEMDVDADQWGEPR